MHSQDPLQSPEAFLKVAHQFRLGELITEQSHPYSRNLSTLAQSNLPEAIEVCRKIDIEALQFFTHHESKIIELANEIRTTWKAGGRLFLCGCGATGRLSLTAETLFREQFPHEPEDRIISFMAGGDAALIRSIERFEDYPDYGARQLRELGFGDKDRLIGITEGGETPFVIGATQAAKSSQFKPWFLYCNPDNLLCQVAKRSKSVIEDPFIQKWNLTIGPMTLSGSTRMQAATVQLLAIYCSIVLALSQSIDSHRNQVRDLITQYQNLDLEFLSQMIEAESQAYLEGYRVLYQTDHYGITVLTDTTERSPTFSLVPFENQYSPSDIPSLAYLEIAESKNSQSAWNKLLHRSPRTLDWPEVNQLTSLNRLYGFDISQQGTALRSLKSKAKTLPFLIHHSDLIMDFAGIQKSLQFSSKPLITKHLILKLLLNTHSTLVMGRLKRYEGNLMTYVKPSNLKLIDRAARYVQTLGNHQQNNPISYQAAVHAVFQIKSQLDQGQIPTDSPTVLKALEYLQ